jgi:recombination protein RecA
VSGSCSAIVIDSVAALLPESEIQRDYGDPQVGAQARLLSSGLRKLAGLASIHNVTLIFINQLRMKIGVMYGNPEVSLRLCCVQPCWLWAFSRSPGCSG